MLSEPWPGSFPVGSPCRPAGWQSRKMALCAGQEAAPLTWKPCANGPPPPGPKANVRVQWVKPKLVCEVAFQEWRSDGKLRAPAFLGLREDKAPTEGRA